VAEPLTVSPAGLPARRPGPWPDTVLAGAPHVAAALLALLPIGGFTYGSAFIPFMALLLSAMTLACLALAWRRGWPAWSAGWWVYAAAAGALVVGVPLQQSSAPTGRLLEGLFFNLALPLASAAGLYWITRHDPLKGLLIILPLVVMVWFPVLEFVRAPLHDALMLGMLMFAAVLAAAVVRLNRLGAAVWMAAGANLLIGLLAAYARTFWNDLPPAYGEPASVSALVERFAPQWVSGAALLIGPLWARQVWNIGQGGGRPGRLAGWRSAAWA
jgi:hypothetical protein